MDDDVALPRATLTKMIKEYMPENMRVSGELIDMTIDCCTEFVHMVYSQANEVSTNEKKTIINPDHILQALQQLGLSGWIPEVQNAWDGHKATSSKNGTRGSGADKSGCGSTELSEEELAALQQKMFSEARERSFSIPDQIMPDDDNNPGQDTDAQAS